MNTFLLFFFKFKYFPIISCGWFVTGTKCFHPGWVKTDMGAEGAIVETSESVAGMIKQIIEFSEKSNGTFTKWDGADIPW